MSAPTGIVLPGASGGAQPDYIIVQPHPGGYANLAWPAANRGYFLKFRLEKPTTITGISIGINSASGNVKVGLYTSDKTTLTNVALSVSTLTALPGGVAGWQDILFTAPVTGVPFQDYYVFLAADNGTWQAMRTSVAAAGLSTLGRGLYELSTAFVTPPSSQLISGLSGTLFQPAVALITTG